MAKDAKIRKLTVGKEYPGEMTSVARESLPKEIRYVNDESSKSSQQKPGTEMNRNRDHSGRICGGPSYLMV